MMISTNPLMSLLIAGLALVSLSAVAEMEVPPGEKPVKTPYVISDANAGTTPIDDPSVFAAFNGKEGISRIVDDMVDANVADPRIGDIFKTSDLVRVRRTLKEQFCYILGGGCAYTGRDMRTSHADLGLRTFEFNVLVEYLQQAMDKEGVPFSAQNKLIAKLAPMFHDMVER